MSVGKTTLVKALKETKQFKNFNFATERSKYLNDLGIPLNTDSTIKGQTIFLAERCAELMNNKIITDRTVIDVMAFTLNASSIDYKDKDIFENYAKEFIREYDYIFYISPYGLPIEDNGVRETDEHYRDVIDFTITSFIRKYAYMMNNIETIKGSTEERVEQILKFTNL